MNYDDLVRDFATRTKTNLAILRQMKKAGGEAYEITALMNSLLGLLVFPQQRLNHLLPGIPFCDLAKNGWPTPTIIEGGYRQVEDLPQLVRYLRNAVCHCNVEFTADGRGEIDGLMVWNTLPGGRTDWKARLTIGDLEKFTSCLIALLVPEHSGNV